MTHKHSNPLMIKASHNPHQLLPFVIQPIMIIKSKEVFGYEILYRGIPPRKWADIDISVIKFLSTLKRPTPTFFVNVANDSLLSVPSEEFIKAARHANALFELSEAFQDTKAFDTIVERVNWLSENGVRFAIDDFGSGLDGLFRLYSLNTNVTAIKLDGVFLASALKHKEAGEVVAGLVARWRKNGILTIAEGIENSELLQYATDLGIDMAQGYFIDDMFNAECAVEKLQYLEKVA